MSNSEDLPDPDLKIILLGDSAVGKSKLVERFLMDEYNPRQLSTYALTLFRKEVKLSESDGSSITVDFWDTAGQESFNRMHPSYYYRAHCCILVFDVTRKLTYQHLSDWYKEFREYCNDVPCILVANKIDVDYNVTRKEFKFAQKHNLPFYFVSAADGTNVVKVFQSAVSEAKRFKESGGDTMGEIMKLLGEEKDSESSNYLELSICGTLNGTTMPSLIPIQISYPLRCIQISCGRKHILALLDDGYVCSWGTGYFGQLGLGDDSSWDSPRMISTLDPNQTGAKIVQVVCGGSHSGALTEKGHVFMWGLNRNGQCGGAAKADSILEPRLVDMSGLEGRVAASIVCGRNHSAMVTNDGRVYSWGAASFGRLGHLETKKKQPVPLEISYFRNVPVHSLVSGDFHMLALGHDCSVYSWGYGAEGQCGHGNTFHLRTPRRIEYFDSLEVVRLAAGAAWSMAITKSGDLYSWGYNDGGWAGISPKKRMPYIEPEPQHHPDLLRHSGHSQSFDSKHNLLIPKRVKLLSNRFVEKVRCGSGHSIIFTSRRNRDSVTNMAGMEVDTDSESEADVKACESFIGLNNQSKSSPSSSKASRESSKDDAKIDQISTSSPIVLSDDPEALSLQMISWARHKKIAELSYALAKGANLNIKDDNGNTPLIIACQNGHSSVCHLLVEHGANLKCANKRGNTPLHYCFAYNFDDLGKFLISQGADEFAVNADGLTCYEGLSLSDLDHI